MSDQLVTVGCKLPNGLICEMGTPGDSKYTRVKLNGANDAKVVGGYGLTDVNSDFMHAWFKKHAWMKAVREGFIFVHANRENAVAEALDTAGHVGGFERLDPTKAPKGIEPDPDHMKQAMRDAQTLSPARSAA